MNLTHLLRRALETKSDEDRVRFMAALGRMIERRLRAIEMWNQKPEYLGYPDVGDWNDVYPSGFEGHTAEYASASPTIDFLTDCLTPALDAGGTMANALRLGEEVGGYITIMVRNFLTDRQKNHDPVGYRVFKNLEAVAEALEARGVVKVSDRSGERHPRIRQASRVQFVNTTAGETATHTDLIEIVLAAPSLSGCLHKLAKKGVGAQRLLCPAIEDLPKSGIREFMFGELLTPLQARVREVVLRWAGDSPSVAPKPGSKAEEKLAEKTRTAAATGSYPTLDEYLAALAPDVRVAIDTEVPQERTRAGLHRILDDWFNHLAERGAEGDDHPPFTEWATRLGVKRATLGDHVQRLREIIDQVIVKRAGGGA